MGKQKENFTKVPNAIMDDPALDVYEVRVLLHIARQTIGYGKKSDGISLSQFVNATGISKSKVQDTIKSLIDKKAIKAISQTSKNGGHSYSRYSVNLYRKETDLYRDTTNPIPHDDKGLYRDTVTQKKIEQKKIDKKRETENIDINNIFFSLSNHERIREANLFAEYISIDASKPEAYKVKIKKQIAKEHPETLEAFQEWYFTKTCELLNHKYVGGMIGDYKIESVYPHNKTKGYADSTHYEADHIYYVQAMSHEGKIKTWGANSSKEMGELLEHLTMKGIKREKDITGNK